MAIPFFPIKFHSARPDPLQLLPVVVLLIQSGCQARCLHCSCWRDLPKQLSPDLVASLLDDFRQLETREIIFSGGEPLLHPQWEKLAALIKSVPARLTLLTNGLLLAEQAQAIVHWFDEVIVSLDGPEPVHDRLRGVAGAYARLAAGVTALRRLRPNLPVKGRCLLQAGNIGEWQATVDAGRELGLDQISFLAVDEHSAAFGRRDRDKAHPGKNPELTVAKMRTESLRLRAEFRRRRADFKSGFIAESPGKLLGIIGQLAGKTPPRRFSRCNAPWASAVLEAEGSLHPCFFHKRYGVLQRGGLAELLNAPTSRAWRKSLRQGKNAHCRACVCRLHRRVD